MKFLFGLCWISNFSFRSNKNSRQFFHGIGLIFSLEWCGGWGGALPLLPYFSHCRSYSLVYHKHNCKSQQVCYCLFFLCVLVCSSLLYLHLLQQLFLRTFTRIVSHKFREWYLSYKVKMEDFNEEERNKIKRSRSDGRKIKN